MEEYALQNINMENNITNIVVWAALILKSIHVHFFFSLVVSKLNSNTLLLLNNSLGTSFLTLICLLICIIRILQRRTLYPSTFSPSSLSNRIELRRRALVVYSNKFLKRFNAGPSLMPFSCKPWNPFSGNTNRNIMSVLSLSPSTWTPPLPFLCRWQRRRSNGWSGRDGNGYLHKILYIIHLR